MRTFTHPHTHTHTHTHSLSYTLSLKRAHTHTLTHTHIHAYTPSAITKLHATHHHHTAFSAKAGSRGARFKSAVHSTRGVLYY